jgi:hypothetical protein
MCGPLCEAVLGMAGSAAILEDLAGSNLLLVPLDRQAEWYRYHHLFGLWCSLWGAVTDCGRCRAWWLAWRHEGELIAVL